MTTIWANRAQRDRQEIYDYIEAANPSAAAELDKKILDAIDLVSTNPSIGHVGRVKGTREFVVHKHYILVYHAAKSVLHVLRIMHTARRSPLPP